MRFLSWWNQLQWSKWPAPCTYLVQQKQWSHGLICSSNTDGPDTAQAGYESVWGSALVHIIFAHKLKSSCSFNNCYVVTCACRDNVQWMAWICTLVRDCWMKILQRILNKEKEASPGSKVFATENWVISSWSMWGEGLRVQMWHQMMMVT